MFRTLACVFVQKFPQCAAALILYEQKVHDAQLKYQGDAWLKYDEGLRQKMQTWPVMEWNCQDMEGFTTHMVAAREDMNLREPTFRPHGPKGKYENQGQSFKSKTQNSGKSGKSCWKYDKDECKWGAACRFKHACGSCGGNHPVTRCKRPKGLGPTKKKEA